MNEHVLKLKKKAGIYIAKSSRKDLFEVGKESKNVPGAGAYNTLQNNRRKFKIILIIINLELGIMILMMQNLTYYIIFLLFIHIVFSIFYFLIILFFKNHFYRNRPKLLFPHSNF